MMANCYEDAREIWSGSWTKQPRFIAAWHDLGTVLKDVMSTRGSCGSGKALTLEPENALTHYYHGAALAMAARPAEAVESYEKAVSIDPELPGAHIGLAMS
ncbi:MAG: hypothetical protein CM15mP74_24630 [Halieaceae bacterium]|nr:MAG: hypothetical protein CM15mP74_24630 [Halieaceae bacterium]